MKRGHVITANREVPELENRPAEKELTFASPAQSALNAAGMSRRSFLTGAGVLLVGFSTKGLLGTATAFAQGRGRGPVDPSVPNPGQLDSWLAIGSDGSITAFTGKVELGQGSSTTQIQLIAEELSVPFERVTLIAGDTARTPDQGVTSGSQTTPTNFNHGALAQAAATAREMLLRTASQRLSVPVEQLSMNNSLIWIKSDPSKHISYAELSPAKNLSWLSIRKPSESLTPNGPSSASAPSAPTCPRWSPANLNSYTTSACPACFTAAWCVRPLSAPRSSAWMKPLSPVSRASSKSSARKIGSA
jgi:hypothetical protein